METSISSLVKELNKKDCPKFIVLKECIALNLNNINEILLDIKKNCKETKDDPFVEILYSEESEKLYGLRVSQILEAINQGKEKNNDQAPV
jgi:hypothetical protein